MNTPNVTATACAPADIVAVAQKEAGDGDIVTKLSPRPVAATVARFTELLAGKGVRVFAVIDQAAAAREAGRTSGKRCW